MSLWWILGFCILLIIGLIVIQKYICILVALIVYECKFYNVKILSLMFLSMTLYVYCFSFWENLYVGMFLRVCCEYTWFLVIMKGAPPLHGLEAFGDHLEFVSQHIQGLKSYKAKLDFEQESAIPYQDLWYVFVDMYIKCTPRQYSDP